MLLRRGAPLQLSTARRWIDSAIFIATDCANGRSGRCDITFSGQEFKPVPYGRGRRWRSVGSGKATACAGSPGHSGKDHNKRMEQQAEYLKSILSIDLTKTELAAIFTRFWESNEDNASRRNCWRARLPRSDGPVRSNVRKRVS